MNNQRIGNVTAFFMISTAVFFDGLQFLLTLTVLGSLLSWLVTLLAATIFFFWFLFCGVRYFDKGGALKMITALGSVVVELVPFIDALPGITAGVVALIIQTRVEDAKKRGEEAMNTRKMLQLDRIARKRIEQSNLVIAAQNARRARLLREGIEE